MERHTPSTSGKIHSIFLCYVVVDKTTQSLQAAPVAERLRVLFLKGPVIIYSQGGSGGNEGGDLKIFSLGKGGHPIILV